MLRSLSLRTLDVAGGPRRGSGATGSLRGRVKADGDDRRIWIDMTAERVQVRKAVTVSTRSHSPPRKRTRRETALLRTSQQQQQTSHSVVLVFLCCLRRRQYSWCRRYLCRTPYRPRPRPRGRSRTPRFQARQRGLLRMSARLEDAAWR